MRKFLSILGCATLLATSISLCAEDAGPTIDQKPAVTRLQPFTGRITSNRVRMRLTPSLDGQVIRDFTKGDLIVVKEEAEDDFYAIEAPIGTEAYVFRTFVLDDMIEGSHVNIRLRPELTSPVIAQLNTGYRIDGTVCPENPKWLQLDAPDTVRFYVAKDYVNRIGGPEIYTKHHERAAEVQHLLREALLVCETEMNNDFEAIAFHALETALSHISESYAEFSAEASLAEETLADAREVYLQKKIDFLETRAELANESWNSINSEISTGISTYQSRLDAIEAEIARELSEDPETAVSITGIARSTKPIANPAPQLATDPEASVSSWAKQEGEMFAIWQSSSDEGELEDFYADEALTSNLVSGILERYDRPVKNKPGDYVILDPHTHRTIAYVYSTSVELHKAVGQRTTLRVVERPNHNFAFPAYFALAIE